MNARDETSQERKLLELTCADLARTVIQEKGWSPSSGSARNFRSCMNTWCTLNGTTPEADSIHFLFGDGFVGRLSKATDKIESEVDSNGKNRSAKNIRSTALQLKEAYDKSLLLEEAGTDFRGAILAAMKSKGWTTQDLTSSVKKLNSGRVPKQLAGYVDGSVTPRTKTSTRMVGFVETALDLPAGFLVARALKGPAELLIQKTQPSAYRDGISNLRNYPYVLKELPPSIKPLIEKYHEWKFKAIVLVNGEPIAIPEKDRWTSESTVKLFDRWVRAYFGFLCLPAPKKPRSLLTDAEKWAHGKGMKLEEVRLDHLFDHVLMLEFCDFLKDRNPNRKHSQSCSLMVLLATAMVYMPYSFVRGNYALLAPHFSVDVDRSDWSGFVDGLSDKLRHLRLQLIAAGALTKQRDPDHPLKILFKEAEPLQTFHKLISAMEDSKPPTGWPVVHAVYIRDILVMRVGIEVPLRAKNLSGLRLNTHLRFDEKTSLWGVVVEKSELKNKTSPHAHEIDRNYSAKTSALLTEYVDVHRKHLKGADQCDLLFLSSGNGVPKRDPLNFEVANLWQIIARRSKQYLGVSIGANVFRHLIATAVLKDDPGQIDAAAALLNNSPKVVAENYKHLTQRDGLRHGSAFLEGQLRKFEGGGGV